MIGESKEVSDRPVFKVRVQVSVVNLKPRTDKKDCPEHYTCVGCPQRMSVDVCTTSDWQVQKAVFDEVSERNSNTVFSEVGDDL